jgi:2-polyprenyl-3-methyl-5-hydroxy-6-metoxy-1,4-benzoquinol methylase
VGSAILGDVCDPEPDGWSVSPSHVLRRSAIIDVASSLPTGQFFEAGAGSGDITRRLQALGFSGYASDLGIETRRHLESVFDSSSVSVVESIDDVDQDVDYVFAFEVLEHIEDDEGALREWTKKLKTGGQILISVPAHQWRFGTADELVGHVRRYDRNDLTRLMTAVGAELQQVICYGFPLAPMTRKVEDLIHAVRPPTITGSAVERSIDSGVKRSKTARAVSRLVSDTTLRPATALQRRFYDTDRGDGFVATAILG